MILNAMEKNLDRGGGAVRILWVGVFHIEQSGKGSLRGCLSKDLRSYLRVEYSRQKDQ